jgi:hypothetical protein
MSRVSLPVCLPACLSPPSPPLSHPSSTSPQGKSCRGTESFTKFLTFWRQLTIKYGRERQDSSGGRVIPLPPDRSVPIHLDVDYITPAQVSNRPQVPIACWAPSGQAMLGALGSTCRPAPPPPLPYPKHF